MAKTKAKKEKIVDLKPKAEKVTEKQLEKVQALINDINRSQMELGQMETRKHAILHSISSLQEAIGVIRDEFEKEYGTSDINIQDGVINYPKENGEADKKD
tara:strand:- start:484 stop:786 length:303 start_codon:yes stop_codon:yes gene_type:complete